jgi:hypothetical protein
MTFLKPHLISVNNIRSSPAGFRFSDGSYSIKSYHAPPPPPPAPPPDLPPPPNPLPPPEDVAKLAKAGRDVLRDDVVILIDLPTSLVEV